MANDSSFPSLKECDEAYRLLNDSYKNLRTELAKCKTDHAAAAEVVAENKRLREWRAGAVVFLQDMLAETERRGIYGNKGTQLLRKLIAEAESDCLLKKAKEKGWAIPTSDVFPDDVWTRYWRAMEDYERNPEKGRPVRPHRSG